MNNAEVLTKEILQSYALGGELSGRYPEAAGELLNLADANGRFKAQDILHIQNCTSLPLNRNSPTLTDPENRRTDGSCTPTFICAISCSRICP